MTEYLQLDLNEMPYGPPENVIKAARQGLQQLNRYADGHALNQLAALLSEYAGVEQERIAIGPGSDLLLREIVMCFGGYRKVVMVSPTFLPTARVAARFARKVVSIRLDRPDFTLARSSLLSELKEPTLVIIDNPNNPTGRLIVDREIVEEILEQPDTMLVVDEAYFEFSGLTFAEKTALHGNLAVVRTLDKAFGLAGARIGYLIAGQAFLDFLSAAFSSLSRPSLAAAIAALQQRSYMWKNVQRIVQERERVSQELSLQGGIVLPSSTNFVLVSSGVPLLAEQLRKRGVAVMDVSDQVGSGFIRVNLGTPEENDAFIRTYAKFGRIQKNRRFVMSSLGRPLEASQQLARIAFGPVPSRRLGHSLGINNIPHKRCTYSCVYCQVGRTLHFQFNPMPFYDPETVAASVAEKAAEAQARNDVVDYLTFVPDGEPTLDLNLGSIIDLLKPLGIKIAVITNATLIDRRAVREALSKADWVSFKIDSVTEMTWERINRPQGGLRLGRIHEGMLEFRRDYKGILVTETMLVRGLNDENGNMNMIAAFLSRLKPQTAYISIPTRPPAESWVLSPPEQNIVRAHQILEREVERVEYLIGYEGNAFASSGNPAEDLLSITAVHPMREEAVEDLLNRAQAGWSVVRRLLRDGALMETEYEGRTYFLRTFPGKKVLG